MYKSNDIFKFEIYAITLSILALSLFSDA